MSSTLDEFGQMLLNLRALHLSIEVQAQCSVTLGDHVFKTWPSPIIIRVKGVEFTKQEGGLLLFAIT